MSPVSTGSARVWRPCSGMSRRNANGKNASQLVRQALALARESNYTGSLKDNSTRNPDVSETQERKQVNGLTVTADKSEETIVEIEVRALEAGGGIFVRYAVLKIDPASPTVYVVLDWRGGQRVE